MLNESLHSEYLNRFGNFTLLLDSTNNYVNNSSFSDKKEVFINESLYITNKRDKEYSVTFYNNWNADSIDKRQKALAKISKEIWGL